LGVK